MAQAVLKFAKSVYPWKICCSPDCFPNKPIFPEMLITRKTATTDFLICLNDQPKELLIFIQQKYILGYFTTIYILSFLTGRLALIATPIYNEKKTLKKKSENEQFAITKNDPKTVTKSVNFKYSLQFTRKQKMQH